MPPKTDRQQVLELRHNATLKEIICGYMDLYRGRDVVMKTSQSMGISDETLRTWCRDLDIDIDEYRKG